ncbi:UNVERIFIED_CONTAM: hypothetical protein GTU68_028800 [Idotea baltica]|nr:hypothetical protein [Idotea baltica]
MTPRGYAVLKAELKDLKGQRPELAKAIEIARAHGDLSENADYDAAKNKSGLTEAKIRDVEARLSLAEVLDPSSITDTSKVVFGCTVELEDLDSGDSKKISIYGSGESDVSKGWLSFESPMAKALIGKEEGDVAKVQVPGGLREFEIMKIYVDYKD